MEILFTVHIDFGIRFLQMLINVCNKKATKMGQMKTIKNEWTFAPVVKHNQEWFHPLMIKTIFIIININLGRNKLIQHRNALLIDDLLLIKKRNCLAKF